jgi:hypothetical protein
MQGKDGPKTSRRCIARESNIRQCFQATILRRANERHNYQDNIETETIDRIKDTGALPKASR